MCQPLFILTGCVVHGNRLGRQLGYPTANLSVENESDYFHLCGVYAVRVRWNNRIFNGITNIGYRPTIGNSHFTVEVHILNFSDDLYGESLVLTFIKKIREEIRFNSLTELIDKIKEDIKIAEDILSAFYNSDA